MGSASARRSAGIWLASGGALVVASVLFFGLFIDAGVRSAILVDTLPGGDSTSELDSYHRTLAWTFAAGLGSVVAAILAIRRGLRRFRAASPRLR